jgi:uncharacterized membrane protein YphA (DoxX/SURF4 family)
MNTSIVDRQTELLRWTYALVPITAGADKFTNLLTDWSKYLSPRARELLPVSPRTFMRAVGVIEIAAGALVLDRKTSRIGAYVVGGWLGAIALNLIANRSFDVAVRDVVMGIGALSLARLLASRDEVRRETPRQRSETDYAPPAPFETTRRTSPVSNPYARR